MNWCMERAYGDKYQRLAWQNLVCVSSSCWLPLWYLWYLGMFLFEISINSENNDFLLAPSSQGGVPFRYLVLIDSINPLASCLLQYLIGLCLFFFLVYVLWIHFFLG
jgi:hypothetical protein